MEKKYSNHMLDYKRTFEDYIAELKSHSLGVHRSEMPQIKDMNEIKDRLHKHGVKFTLENGMLSKFKPIQQTYSREPEPTLCLDKRILVSSDDYILDGHHRWQNNLCWMFKNFKCEVACHYVRLDKPVLECLKLLKVESENQ